MLMLCLDPTAATRLALHFSACILCALDKNVRFSCGALHEQLRGLGSHDRSCQAFGIAFCGISLSVRSRLPRFHGTALGHAVREKAMPAARCPLPAAMPTPSPSQLNSPAKTSLARPLQLLANDPLLRLSLPRSVPGHSSCGAMTAGHSRSVVAVDRNLAANTCAFGRKVAQTFVDWG